MKKKMSKTYVALSCPKGDVVLAFASLKSATVFMDAATDALTVVHTSLSFNLSNDGKSEESGAESEI